MRKVIIVCKNCHRRWKGETLSKNSPPVVHIRCNDCVWKEWVKRGLVSPAKNYAKR